MLDVWSTVKFRSFSFSIQANRNSANSTCRSTSDVWWIMPIQRLPVRMDARLYAYCKPQVTPCRPVKTTRIDKNVESHGEWRVNPDMIGLNENGNNGVLLRLYPPPPPIWSFLQRLLLQFLPPFIDCIVRSHKLDSYMSWKWNTHTHTHTNT